MELRSKAAGNAKLSTDLAKKFAEVRLLVVQSSIHHISKVLPEYQENSSSIVEREKRRCFKILRSCGKHPVHWFHGE
jgi:hypothetical protein